MSSPRSIAWGTLMQSVVAELEGLRGYASQPGAKQTRHLSRLCKHAQGMPRLAQVKRCSCRSQRLKLHRCWPRIMINSCERLRTCQLWNCQPSSTGMAHITPMKVTAIMATKRLNQHSMSKRAYLCRPASGPSFFCLFEMSESLN